MVACPESVLLDSKEYYTPIILFPLRLSWRSVRQGLDGGVSVLHGCFATCPRAAPKRRCPQGGAGGQAEGQEGQEGKEGEEEEEEDDGRGSLSSKGGTPEVHHTRPAQEYRPPLQYQNSTPHLTVPQRWL